MFAKLLHTRVLGGITNKILGHILALAFGSHTPFSLAVLSMMLAGKHSPV